MAPQPKLLLIMVKGEQEPELVDACRDTVQGSAIFLALVMCLAALLRLLLDEHASISVGVFSCSP